MRSLGRQHLSSALSCLAALTVVVGCGAGDSSPAAETEDLDAPPAAGSPTRADTEVDLVEWTAETGVEFRYAMGSDPYAMPSIMAGGLALLDYDADGDLDLYVVAYADEDGGGGANRLYRQEAPGRFVDVSRAADVDDAGYGMGAAVGDFDNDGHVDLFVSNWGPDRLFRNRGDGTFEEVSAELGVDDAGWSASATFVDLDADGWLDLYVSRYVDFDPAKECAVEGGRRDFCGPQQFQGVSDLVYRNDSGRRFVDRSRELGVDAYDDAGLGVVAADFDGDGRQDVYVANDSDPNQLWLSQADGSLVEEAVFAGVAYNRFGVGEAGMGVALGDVDGDGDADLFVTHLYEETNTLYQNRGGFGFEDFTAEVGLGLPSAPYTGFGTALFDIDNDGDLDLAVANGGVKRRPASLDPAHPLADYVEPNSLLLNERSRYTDVSDSCGGFCSQIEVSRALLAADLDADGDLDLVTSQLGGPLRIFQNRTATRAWLGLRLVDPRYRRIALGAVATVVAGERRQTSTVVSSTGYLSATEGWLHFGLDQWSGPVSVEVRWPDGLGERFEVDQTGAWLELTRGEGSGE